MGEIDRDGSGSVSLKELERFAANRDGIAAGNVAAQRALVRVQRQCAAYPELDVLAPFRKRDPGSRGTVTEREFLAALRCAALTLFPPLWLRRGGALCARSLRSATRACPLRTATHGHWRARSRARRGAPPTTGSSSLPQRTSRASRASGPRVRALLSLHTHGHTATPRNCSDGRDPRARLHDQPPGHVCSVRRGQQRAAGEAGVSPRSGGSGPQAASMVRPAPCAVGGEC